MVNQQHLLANEKLPKRDKTKRVLSYAGPVTTKINIEALANTYTINQIEAIIKTIIKQALDQQSEQEKKLLEKNILPESAYQPKLTHALTEIIVETYISKPRKITTTTSPNGITTSDPIIFEEHLLHETIDALAQNNTRLTPNDITVSINHQAVTRKAPTIVEEILQQVINLKLNQKQKTP